MRNGAEEESQKDMAALSRGGTVVCRRFDSQSWRIWQLFSEEKRVKSRFLLGLAIPDDLWYGVRIINK